MLPLIWLIGVIILLTLFAPRIVEMVRRRRLLINTIDRLPGPRALPLIGCAYQFSLNSLKFTYTMEQYFLEYSLGAGGSGLFRLWIGPVPIVLVCRPQAAKVILESNTLIKKPSQYDFLGRFIGSGLLISNGEKWYTRRKMLTPAFHFNILHNFIEVFNKQAEILMSLLEKYAVSGDPFDIYPYVKRCALDIICEAAMGTEIGAQQMRNNEYVEAVRRICELIWQHERLPWLWLNPIWYGSGQGFEFDRHLQLVTGFTRKVIADRQKEWLEKQSFTIEELTKGKKVNKLAFLDLLLSMQREHKLTDEDIREEVDTFMFEGHETVSSSMGFSLFLLGHRPEIQTKIFEEQDAIFGDSDREPTMEDLREMKYLEMCIKEALRVLPTVPMIAREMTEDTEVCGYLIPKGVTAMYENPFDFDPDNFLPEKVAKRSPYAFIPFSAGPRNCIGIRFALFEEKVILSYIFRKYRVISMISEDDNRPLPELIMKPSQGFPIRLEPR